MARSKKFSETGFTGYGVDLLPVTPQDLPSLRRWRNSTKISQHMVDASHITPHQQKLWFDRIKGSTDRADWVVWCRGVRTGYVNIHGHGPLAQQSSLSGGYYIADSPIRHALLGFAAVLMYHDIIFEHVGVPEIRDTVMKTNSTARKMNLKFGYHEGAEEGNQIPITLKASDYRKSRKKFLRFFKDPHCLMIGVPHV